MISMPMVTLALELHIILCSISIYYMLLETCFEEMAQMMGMKEEG